MARKKIEKVDFKLLGSYDEYPFPIEGIGKKIYTLKSDERQWADLSSGELMIVRPTDNNKEVDHDSLSYTKLFRNPSKEVLKNLSIPASNMFFMISCNIDINSKHICISEEDFASHCGYSAGSKRLYYQAIGELCVKGVLKRRSGFSRCYWVNANIIYNGDRTKIK